MFPVPPSVRPPVQRGALGVLTLATLLVGCGPEPEPGLGQELLEQTLGAQLDPVVNEGPGEWGDGVRQATLDLAVGTLEGDPPTVFGNIRSIEVDGAGRIYVLDSQATEVRVFDPDGTHRTTWGRSGEGPEDLLRPSFLRLAPDGNLVLFSLDKTYRTFTPQGEFVSYHRREPSGVILRASVEVLDDGRFLDWDLDRETLLDDGSVEENPNLLNNPRFDRFDKLVIHYIPVVLDPGTGRVDTLPRVTYELPYAYGSLRSFTGSNRMSLPRDGRMWMAWTDDYVLVERGLDGTVHRSIARADPRRPATPDSAVEAYFESVRATEAQAGGRVFAPVDRSDFPATGPFLGMLIHDDRHLLVFTEEEGETPDFFADIFRKSDGRYLGKVEFPVRIYQTVRPVLDGRYLYGVTIHDGGFPQLVRLDLGPME